MPSSSSSSDLDSMPPSPVAKAPLDSEMSSEAGFGVKELDRRSDSIISSVSSSEIDEERQFPNWCAFFLTSLGLAVGLGNIWRFPYICYANVRSFYYNLLLCMIMNE